MRTINKLFIAGELNRWLYWKIDSLFVEDYPRINRLQKNFKYWTGLFTIIYLFLSVWIHDLVCKNNHTDERIPLWWLVLFVMIPVSSYLFLVYFRRIRFMYYYRSLRDAISIDYFGFDHFLCELDRDHNHAVFDPDGYMYQNLIRQLRNGILSIEAKVGDRAQETSEWLYYRDRFSQSFLFLKRFRLIAKPDQGWTPYLRLAKEPIIRESNPS